jgi:hypothetical protein
MGPRRCGRHKKDTLRYGAIPLRVSTRYNFARREVQGYDPTVGFPTKDERAARELLDLTDAKSLLAITIPTPAQPQKLHRYIVCGPCAQPDIPKGRWTRVSIAYDSQRKKGVLLKDYWWALQDGFKPEGEVYDLLYRHSVPNIPHCSWAGNVGDDIDKYHRSQTHRFIRKYGIP